MAAEDLLAALQGLKYAPVESPYGVAGTALSQAMPQLITPTMSTGKALGLSLGSVLLSGLLGYQARRDAAAANLESAKLGLQLQSAMTPEARLGIIEQAGGGTMGDLQSRLLDVNNILGAQELARKQATANKLAELETAAQFNLGDLGTKVFEREQQAKLEQLRASHPPKETPKGFGPQEPIVKKGLFGEYETTADKRNRLIKEASNLGVPPSDRLDYANKNLRTEELQTKSALDEINKLRQNISNADSLISRATTGIAGAGETGGWTPWAATREIASSIYAISPTSGGKQEAQQRAAQKELDSIAPELILNLKAPGAVSNYEDRLLIGAGPSSSNTPTENQRLLANMIELNKLNNDYVSFKETYIQDKGDAIGASRLWDQYKKDEAIKGNVINPNRVSWEEYFQSKTSGGISDSERRNRELKAELAQLEALAAAQGK
jgi:hypothetical protein